MPTEFEKVVGQADPRTVAAARARDKAHMAAMSDAAMDPTNEGCATAAHDYAPRFTSVESRYWPGSGPRPAWRVHLADWWRGFVRLPDWWPVSRRAFHVEQEWSRAEKRHQSRMHDLTDYALRELRAKPKTSMDEYATLREQIREVAKDLDRRLSSGGAVVKAIGELRERLDATRQVMEGMNERAAAERVAVRGLLAACLPDSAVASVAAGGVVVKVRKSRRIDMPAKPKPKAKPRTRKAAKG